MTALFLTITAIMLSWGTAASARTLEVQEHTTHNATYTAYMELSVEPPVASTGTLITLHIAYHNIGEPYTYISINPPGLVAFEPPLSMPCKYYEHAGCTAITFRTLSSGEVEFTASATGEVFDDDCGCWRWAGGSDNGPARLIIEGTIWQIFLPFVQR
jgi:hypothetical protein